MAQYTGAILQECDKWVELQIGPSDPVEENPEEVLNLSVREDRKPQQAEEVHSFCSKINGL